MESESKICPMKRAICDDVLVFQNVDVTKELRQAFAEEMKKCGPLALSVATDGPAMGRCDKEQCGWWNEQKEQCAVVALSNR